MPEREGVGDRRAQPHPVLLRLGPAEVGGVGDLLDVQAGDLEGGDVEVGPERPALAPCLPLAVVDGEAVEETSHDVVGVGEVEVSARQGGDLGPGRSCRAAGLAGCRDGEGGGVRAGPGQGHAKAGGRARGLEELAAAGGGGHRGAPRILDGGCGWEFSNDTVASGEWRVAVGSGEWRVR